MANFILILVPLVHFLGINSFFVYADAIASVISFFLCVVIIMLNRAKIYRDSYIYLFYAILIVSAASVALLFSGNFPWSEWTMKALAKIIVFSMWGFVLSLLLNNKRELLFFIGFFIILVFFSTTVVGFLQLLRGGRFIGQEYFEESLYTGIRYRLASLHQYDPNFTVVDLLFLLSFLVFYLYFAKSIGIKLLLIGAFVLSFFALLATQSRSSLVALALALLTYAAMRIRKVRLSPLIVGSVVLFLALGLVMLYVLLQQPEVYESLYANILSRLQTAYNLELRFQIWRSLLGYEWFNPLCGAGGVDPREVVLSEAGRFITPHNSYISFIFDFGLIGFIPLVMSWFTTLSNLYRASRDYLFVSSLFIGCLSYLIFIFSIADPQGFYLFMLLALSLKMPRILGEER